MFFVYFILKSSLYVSQFHYSSIRIIPIIFKKFLAKDVNITKYLSKFIKIIIIKKEHVFQESQFNKSNKDRFCVLFIYYSFMSYVIKVSF